MQIWYLIQLYILEDPYKAAENIAKSFGLSSKGRGKVDGLANGNMPIVYPSGKIVRTITMTGTVTIGLNVHQIYGLLFDGLSSFSDSQVNIDQKLKTALSCLMPIFTSNPQAQNSGL